MSIFKKVAVSATAMSMVLVPALSHAADASKLSVAQNARAGKAANAEDNAIGGGIIVGVLAAAAIIGGIIIATDGDDDDDDASS